MMTPDEIIANKQNLQGADLSGADLYEANLREANLSGADLLWANLRRADLQGADLRRANLGGADLLWANLRRADLQGANLIGANLRMANLYGADLSRTDLQEANLRGAELRWTDLCRAKLPHFQLPDGNLIVWGRKNKVIVQLRIPSNARRTACLINRKCRAEWADVIEVYNDERRVEVVNEYGTTVYEAGSRVLPHEYNDDIRIDCAGGIHFWLTRAEAEEW